jgi:hypothetical protein
MMLPERPELTKADYFDKKEQEYHIITHFGLNKAL